MGQSHTERGQVGGGGQGDQEGKLSQIKGEPASLSHLLVYTRHPTHFHHSSPNCAWVSEPLRENSHLHGNGLLYLLKHLLSPNMSLAVSWYGGFMVKMAQTWAQELT